MLLPIAVPSGAHSLSLSSHVIAYAGASRMVVCLMGGNKEAAVGVARVGDQCEIQCRLQPLELVGDRTLDAEHVRLHGKLWVDPFENGAVFERGADGLPRKF